ncbi:PIN domain-containing protein [uncultured Sphingomonas sp.]|uniref:PIN domain-containing protein n=1 Tax=uncultured Sphingomonas sp. TaxID=158754 RepID=UPI0035CA9440
MRIAFDTNILAYLAGVKRASADPEKIHRARHVVRHLNNEHHFVVATQVLGELLNVLLRSGIEHQDARMIVRRYSDQYEIVASDQACFEQAFELVVDHRMQVWDALIVTTSARAGCELLLSEHMQYGFAVLGITVLNAVATHPHSQLVALLDG